MIPLIPLLYVVPVTVDSTLSVLSARLVKSEIGPEKGPDYGPSEDGHRVSPHQLPDEGHRAVLEHSDYVLPHEIQVFLTHVGDLVFDLAGVVDHYEGSLFGLRLLVEFVVLVDHVEFLKQRFVGGPREAMSKKIY